MYYFEMDEVVDERFLTKLVWNFQQNHLGRFITLENYYNVRNEAIASRTMKGKKPNNKIFHGFAKYITNMATSYFIGRPVEYQVEDPEYKELLMQYLNESGSFDYEISKEASKKGIAFELLYVDERGELRARQYRAEDIIPIYSSNPGEFLNGFIKLSRTYDLDGKLITEKAAVYDKANIWIFSRRYGAGLFSLEDIQSHFLGDVPLIVYWNTQERAGDYESVLSLIDAYDRAESNTANDMDYFTDAYLVIRGSEGGMVDAQGEDLDQNKAEETLRNCRVMYLDERGDAKFLVKDDDDGSIENFKDRLFKDIFFTSQVPAMTDESFAGDLSGIAIKYKLIGLEQLAIMKENRMRLAKAKKIQMITDWINLKKSTKYDARTVRQKYTRNFIENISEIIENAAKLESVVSKRTQLGMLPGEIVKDVEEEIKQIEKEARESEGLFMEGEV